MFISFEYRPLLSCIIYLFFFRPFLFYFHSIFILSLRPQRGAGIWLNIFSRYILKKKKKKNIRITHIYLLFISFEYRPLFPCIIYLLFFMFSFIIHSNFQGIFWRRKRKQQHSKHTYLRMRIMESFWIQSSICFFGFATSPSIHELFLDFIIIQSRQ